MDKASKDRAVSAMSDIDKGSNTAPTEGTTRVGPGGGGGQTPKPPNDPEKPGKNKPKP